ncbi:hypothetical protein ES705_26624 [subsurface metagenome]
MAKDILKFLREKEYVSGEVLAKKIGYLPGGSLEADTKAKRYWI